MFFLQRNCWFRHRYVSSINYYKVLKYYQFFKNSFLFKALIILNERTKFARGTHKGDITETDVRPICLPRIGRNMKVVGNEALVRLTLKLVKFDIEIMTWLVK